MKKLEKKYTCRMANMFVNWQFYNDELDFFQSDRSENAQL